MTAGLHYSKSISPTAIPSGDYWDTAEENGLRIKGKVPITYVGAASATTIKAVDGGTADIGDGITGTGSTVAVTFTAAYTATPVVIATQDIEAGTGTLAYQGTDHLGSHSVVVAGRTTGSAVFYGISGTGFNWMAYGDKY